jgi:hypothetical protein
MTGCRRVIRLDLSLVHLQHSASAGTTARPRRANGRGLKASR